ncbi:hypothetical protein [Actinocorallia sp. A-T 12471]|uniref:hypothetical protein n=1 Tax=Actinocorallia sp. A-T 12471 TaxID=3089813 RepID=UPI0029D16B9E|nr:hypothetical protein [Actinocorallia sp. A-T 12471]MDX6744567.1 hypothetical protein [Actinocorallia sp. A-T 12471]
MRTNMGNTDEIAALQTFRADLPELGERAEAAARADLLANLAMRPTPRRRPVLRIGVGLATAAAATAVWASAGQLTTDGEARYSNAAVEVAKSDDGWTIEIKDGSADPAAYREALTGAGLNVDLDFVSALTPLSAPDPDTLDDGLLASEIRIQDCAKGDRPENCDVVVVTSGKAKDSDKAETLRGLTVAEAVKKAEDLNLGVSFASGTLNASGKGTIHIPAKPWTPSDDAKISGAYLSTPTKLTLITEETLP